MEYLNEKYPYTYGDAVACSYNYEDTCILQGVITWDKKLIIVREYWFQKESMTNVASRLKFTKPWIKKNNYFGELFRACYFADFSDENDLLMLQDIFQELKDNKRIIYEAERTATRKRDECLQILMKALNPALNSSGKRYSFSHHGNEDFPEPRDISEKRIPEEPRVYQGCISKIYPETEINIAMREFKESMRRGWF